MNTYKSKLYAALAAASVAASALADNASQTPAIQNLSGTLPYSDSFQITITSPSKLTGGPTTPFPSAGVDVSPKVTSVDSYPVGADPVAAKGYVAFSVASLHYTSFNQPMSFTAFVNVPAGAPEGDYVYTIQGDPNPNGGWGLGAGTTLTVSVSNPVVTDTTPPQVQITSPADGMSYSFCIGGRAVDVAVSANDAESAVSAVSATVDGTAVVLDELGLGTGNVTASGTFVAQSIGSYVVNAEATSVGGAGYASPVSFTVSYDLTWLPPLSLGKTAKGGSTVPVKFAIKDCEGRFIRDESVVVAAFRNGSIDPAFIATFGEGSDSVRIDEGDPLIDSDGHYIANLQTASGAATYQVVVYFGGTHNGVSVDAIEQGSKSFNTR